MPDHAVVEPGWWKLFAEACEVPRQILFDPLAKIFSFRVALIAQRIGQRLGQFLVDDLGREYVLRVKGRDAAYKIFQLANVALPWVGLEELNGACLDRLLTKALTRSTPQKVTHEIAHVLQPLA